MRSLISGLVLIALMIGGCASPTERRAQKHEMPAPVQPKEPPPIRNEPLNPSLTAAARKELETALAANDPYIRTNALEAAQTTLGAQAKAAYLKALDDPHKLVRYAATLAVGQLRLAEAKPQLLQMVNDRDQLVRIGVRFALHRLGDKTYSKDLEATAADFDPFIRANTALVLGLLNEPTAVNVLRPMAKDPSAVVRLQVAESLWRYGDQAGLKALISATQSGYPDDQAIALASLAAPKDRRVLGHLRAALTADYTLVALVAARAAGMVGSDAGYAIAQEGTRSKDPRQRALAALALGAIGRTDAQGMLGQLLDDGESAYVRVCAAKAVLQLQPAGTANARND